MVFRRFFRYIDIITVLIVLALVGMGLVSIANVMASPFDGSESSLADFTSRLNLQYVEKQAVNFLVGLAGFLIVLVIDYEYLKPVIKYFYFANVFLLLVLFLVDKTRGISGWFVFEAIDRAIQPAEICKISVIVMLSKIISEDMDNEGHLRSAKSIGTAILYCLVPAVLIYLQPDFGTMFVYIVVLCVMLFTAKIAWGYIIAAVSAMLVGFPIAYFTILSDEQINRIQVFLDPSKDPMGAGYNVIQSKISIGSGQLSGKGFFSSGTLAQLKFVPERHTDFIFSGIVEGLGFIGGTIIIVLYFLLMFRWIWVAIKAKDNFGTCIVSGVTAMLMAHVFENIGMTIGLMPVTGIPLPFISYGGSNLLTSMIGVGLVMNVWLRRPQKKGQGQLSRL
ncbi:MAG: rod shape-determining protein RodA [Clostridia bacterium]|nr:rod shape-determining protein RodA [Clostridia bacterium]